MRQPDAWLEAIKKGEPPGSRTSHLDGDDQGPETGRDARRHRHDGRFRFEGLGAERGIELKLQGDAIAYVSIDVVTRRSGRSRRRLRQPCMARGRRPSTGPTSLHHGGRPGRSRGSSATPRRSSPCRSEDRELHVLRFHLGGIPDLKTVTDAQAASGWSVCPRGRGTRHGGPQRRSALFPAGNPRGRSRGNRPR